MDTQYSAMKAILRMINDKAFQVRYKRAITDFVRSRKFGFVTIVGLEVYQGRWTSMEEGYKNKKITMQLENFSGKTVTAIKQEYWAMLVVANLLEMGCIAVEGCWIPGNLPEKHVNRSVLFGSMRDAIIETIFGLMSPEAYDQKFKQGRTVYVGSSPK